MKPLTAGTHPTHDWFAGDELVECVNCGIRSYSRDAATVCEHAGRTAVADDAMSHRTEAMKHAELFLAWFNDDPTVLACAALELADYLDELASDLPIPQR